MPEPQKEPRTKDEIEQAEAGWMRKAQRENLRCRVCSTYIPYSDRQIFFDKGLCAHCAYVEDRDD